MYLVMLSHCMDDIPLAIFPERDAELAKFVDEVNPDIVPSYWMADCSMPVCVQLVTLEWNPMKRRWLPRSVECVRSFDNDDDSIDSEK